jgi:prepilin-type N-terminal cleavage/methylation domain-containing protein
MQFSGKPSGRSGFTLLEVLLAFAIGVLLMAALYVAVDVQLHHAQAGRDAATDAGVVRNVLEHMASDIKAHLAPTLPASINSSGNQASSAGATSAAGAATAASNSTASPSSSTSTGSAGSTGGTGNAASTSTTSTGDTFVFNLGVQGAQNQLTLFDSKLPRELIKPPAVLDSQTLPVLSDLRCITYWLAGGGDQPLGLARQEIKIATSSDLLSNLPPNIPDEASHVIAEEVKRLSFSYFDGSNWQDTWDGTALGPDNATPIGPPVAIAITIGVAPSSAAGQGTSNLKTYRHVVLIPTANGAMNTNVTTTPTGQ